MSFSDTERQEMFFDAMEYTSGEGETSGSSPESDFDDFVDLDASRAHGPTTKSEKRRAQDEVFRNFAVQKGEEVTETEIKQILKDADDNNLSVRDILARQDISSSIVSPRDYQTELYEKRL